MASRKDMRRADYVIPYQQPKDEKANEFGSTMTSTLPMAAMFTRNRLLGWVSMTVALLNWIGETPAQKNTSATPGYLSFGMSLLAVGVTYMPLFMPPSVAPSQATGTGAPAPVPN